MFQLFSKTALFTTRALFTNYERLIIRLFLWKRATELKSGGSVRLQAERGRCEALFHEHVWRGLFQTWGFISIHISSETRKRFFKAEIHLPCQEIWLRNWIIFNNDISCNKLRDSESKPIEILPTRNVTLFLKGVLNEQLGLVNNNIIYFTKTLAYNKLCAF